MTGSRHGARIAGLMLLAAVLFGWLANHSAVMFNDGLRYIRQGQQIESGSFQVGLVKSVDHPIYPLFIAGWHKLLGGTAPPSWETAGQVASVASAVLWVIPLYLIALELYGSSAWLAVLLGLLVPLTGHVFGDVLSESTFLLFWTWSVWCALRFLRNGWFGWLPVTVAFSALAYLTRPEGLLLPLALVGSLALMPLLRSTRLNWPRWWSAVGFLVIAPSLILGPYVMLKGGLGTKPAVARLLGTAPKSAAQAVERQRPLDPNQSTLKTYTIAVREVATSIRDGVTLPLLPFVLVGLCFAWPPGDKARAWILISLILVGSFLALVRLHATGGYCTPRHAMIMVYPLICLAAFGIHSLVSRVTIPGRWLGLEEGRYEAGPAVWLLVLVLLGVFAGREALAPINLANAGYRTAGAYLAEHATGEDRVVDLTGLSLFYGSKQGYTFKDLHAAPGDPRTRWVVVREAHLKGGWPYCERIREIVGTKSPVATFPEIPVHSQAKVMVFQIDRPTAAVATGEKPKG